MSDFVYLRDLPVGHVMRNMSLAAIKAEQRNNAGPSTAWKRVEPHWRIAGNTFNELGAAWMQYAEWRAPWPMVKRDG